MASSTLAGLYLQNLMDIQFQMSVIIHLFSFIRKHLDEGRLRGNSWRELKDNQ